MLFSNRKQRIVEKSPKNVQVSKNKLSIEPKALVLQSPVKTIIQGADDKQKKWTFFQKIFNQKLKEPSQLTQEEKLDLVSLYIFIKITLFGWLLTILSIVNLIKRFGTVRSHQIVQVSIFSILKIFNLWPVIKFFSKLYTIILNK